jgi:hypothetical protein
MSIRIMTAVWSDAPYTQGTLLVLLALADWADDSGYCWPKVEKIAEKARLSERATQDAIRRLISNGDLSIAEESPGPGLPRKYQIGVQYLHPSFKKGVQSEAKRGAVDDKKGCSSQHRNKEEPSLEPSVIQPSPSDPATQGSGGTASPSETKPPKKAKSKAKNPDADPRFPLFVEKYKSYWDTANKAIAFNFSDVDGAQLRLYLKRHPNRTIDEWRRILWNRLQSEGTIRTQELFRWIPRADDYLAGPITRFDRAKSTAPPPATSRGAPDEIPQWKQQLIDENNRKYRLGQLEPDEIEKFRSKGLLTANGEPGHKT